MSSGIRTVTPLLLLRLERGARYDGASLIALLGVWVPGKEDRRLGWDL